ncbi:hypothetical protein AB0O72_31350, partial [Streptomyces sp. NPDC088106]
AVVCAAAVLMLVGCGQRAAQYGSDFASAEELPEKLKYRGFVTASQNAYEKAGGAKEPEGPGTPTTEINGKRIPLQYNALLLESDTFAELLQKIHDQPGEWEDTTL